MSPTAPNQGPLPDIFDVEGRVIFVTGAASGLGLAIAEVLARRGAKLTFADIDREALQKVTEPIVRSGLRIDTVVLDVCNRDQVAAAITETANKYGRLDVVFANAGISAGPGFGAAEAGFIENVLPAIWDRVVATNLTGVFSTIQAAARCMKPQKFGSIVVTASTAGLKAEPVVGYAYVATKSAVVSLVRQAAIELAPFNVRINAIAPGPFLTNIAGGRLRDPEQNNLFRQLVPLGRIARVEEMRGLALLLASDASSFITGATIPIDGGLTAK